jgi:predicted lipoprotein with Yx(FWY)xxD motif
MKCVPLAVLCALIIAVPSVWANWAKDGVALCTATGDQSYPAIVSDGAGGAIVTWWDYRNGNYDVYAQRADASGAVQWAANGVALSTATGSQYYSTITSDGAGGAIVAWEDYRSGSNLDIYAQRVDASGAVQWTTDGVPLCTATLDQYDCDITSDGAGGAIVAWRDYRSADWNIYVQRVNASGVVQWGENGVAICAAASDQEHPMLISDGAGGAIVAWMDHRSGTSYDIYAQRVDESGAAQWTADGVALCTATRDQYDPEIASDGAGGAVVTWEDFRGGPGIIGVYAQRVSASGAVQWTIDGVALCTLSGFQENPTVASDGVGGAIVTWFDLRSLHWDIYAQRVNASGAVEWTPDGVALCTATGDQDFPVITSDGVGGAIVAWYDGRNASNYDIYAQRVDSSGTVLWTANGVPLCTAALVQSDCVIASDGSAGAIVTWIDGRNGNQDIYGVRVDANGFPVLTGTGAPAASVVLRQNYPNPFNPTTTLSYSIPAKCHVTLEIYDISGMRVARLVDTPQDKGSYEVGWSGKDGAGNSLASGVYFYQLTAGTQTISKKMVLLR